MDSRKKAFFLLLFFEHQMFANPFHEEIFSNLNILGAIWGCFLSSCHLWLRREWPPPVTMTSFQIVVERGKVTSESSFFQNKSPPIPSAGPRKTSAPDHSPALLHFSRLVSAPQCFSCSEKTFNTSWIQAWILGSYGKQVFMSSRVGSALAAWMYKTVAELQ